MSTKQRELGSALKIFCETKRKGNLKRIRGIGKERNLSYTHFSVFLYVAGKMYHPESQG